MKSLITVFLAISIPLLAADPPAMINHQGRIAVSGTNYDGTGYFKFAFVNGAGTTTYWSNDGTSASGSEPTDAVAVTVSNGHYAVSLGDDSLTNMTTIPSATFTDNNDVNLRIWFATGMAGPYEQLSPDRRITSSAYALNAAKAQGVADMSITSAMLADGAVTSAKIDSGAVTSEGLAAGAAAANIEADQSLGIGLDGDSPDATLQLNGEVDFYSPSVLSVVKDEVNGFTALDGASYVSVSGNKACVTSLLENSVTVIDVSDPSNPQLLAEMRDGIGGFNRLYGPGEVKVVGNTAFVLSTIEDAITIIDITNGAAPALLAEIVDGIGGFNELNGVSSIHIEGSLLYVTSSVDDSLTIINVANPAAPVLVAEVKNGVNGFSLLDNPIDVEVAGTRAYVLGRGDDAITTIDVSAPSSPVLVREDALLTLDSPIAMALAGTHFLVADNDDTVVEIFTLPEPAAPSYTGEFGLIDNASWIEVNGTTAFVCGDVRNWSDSGYVDGVLVVDISDPANTKVIGQFSDGLSGFNELEGARSVDISGAVAYIPSLFDDSLTIVDLTTTERADIMTENWVGIGTTMPATELHVKGDAFFTGSLYDSNFGAGSVGQFLSSTGSGTSWVDVPDFGLYFPKDGSEDLTGQLNVTGGGILLNNNEAYMGKDSGGTAREMLKKTDS